MERSSYPVLKIAEDRIRSDRIDPRNGSLGHKFDFIYIPASHGVSCIRYNSYGCAPEGMYYEYRISEVLRFYKKKAWNTNEPHWAFQNRLGGITTEPLQEIPHEVPEFAQLIEWLYTKIDIHIIFMFPHHNVCELDIYTKQTFDDPTRYQRYLLRLMKDKLHDLCTP